MHPSTARTLARWLYAWSGMLVLLVVIGGITRLTESGLSITEWRPVTGVLPPLSEAAWLEEFAKYQRIPEYQQLNAGMSLTEFKRGLRGEGGDDEEEKKLDAPEKGEDKAGEKP